MLVADITTMMEAWTNALSAALVANVPTILALGGSIFALLTLVRFAKRWIGGTR